MAAHSTKPIRPTLLVLAVSLLAALLLAVPPASARMTGAIGASGEPALVSDTSIVTTNPPAFAPATPEILCGAAAGVMR